MSAEVSLEFVNNNTEVLFKAVTEGGVTTFTLDKENSRNLGTALVTASKLLKDKKPKLEIVKP